MPGRGVGELDGASGGELREVILITKLTVGIDRDLRLAVGTCLDEALELLRVHRLHIARPLLDGKLPFCGKRRKSGTPEGEAESHALE